MREREQILDHLANARTLIEKNGLHYIDGDPFGGAAWGFYSMLCRVQEYFVGRLELAAETDPIANSHMTTTIAQLRKELHDTYEGQLKQAYEVYKGNADSNITMREIQWLEGKYTEYGGDPETLQIEVDGEYSDFDCFLVPGQDAQPDPEPYDDGQDFDEPYPPTGNGYYFTEGPL